MPGDPQEPGARAGTDGGCRSGAAAAARSRHRGLCAEASNPTLQPSSVLLLFSFEYQRYSFPLSPGRKNNTQTHTHARMQKLPPTSGVEHRHSEGANASKADSPLRLRETCSCAGSPREACLLLQHRKPFGISTLYSITELIVIPVALPAAWSFGSGSHRRALRAVRGLGGFSLTQPGRGGFSATGAMKPPHLATASRDNTRAIRRL